MNWREYRAVEKVAFFAPFKSKNKEEYESPGGYMKEWGNQLLSGIAGATLGGIVGRAAGLVSKKHSIPLRLGGGIAGALIGELAATQKSRKAAGLEPATPGQIAGRVGATMAGNAVVPFLGGSIADYFVSRKIQENKKLKEAK